MADIYKVPLILTPHPEGGYTVTSPLLPALVTEGGMLEEALAHVHYALQAVVELYADFGKPLPWALGQQPEEAPLHITYAVTLP